MSSIMKNVDAIAQSLLARPQLVKTLQASATVSLGIITGVATCLHVWVIPIIQQAGSARTKAKQFRAAVTLGFQYLQPFSKVFAVTLASLAFLCSRSQNPIVYSRWKFYAAAMGAMLPVAPYEITTIFPTNDRMFDIDDELQRGVKDEVEKDRNQEIDSLLTSWRTWHTGRIIMPLVAASILAWSAVDLMPL